MASLSWQQAWHGRSVLEEAADVVCRQRTMSCGRPPVLGSLTVLQFLASVCCACIAHIPHKSHAPFLFDTGDRECVSDPACRASLIGGRRESRRQHTTPRAWAARRRGRCWHSAGAARYPTTVTRTLSRSRYSRLCMPLCASRVPLSLKAFLSCVLYASDNTGRKLI